MGSKKRSKPQTQLGRVELEVMKVVWTKGQATVHEVKEALGRGRKPAYTTVLTTMRNLEQKGYLKHTTEGRTYLYRPAVEKESVTQNLLGDLMDRLFEGSPVRLVNHLLDCETMSRDELGELSSLLDEHRKKKDG